MFLHRDGDIRVLVADEDTEHVTSLVRILGEDGFHLSHARTVDQALELYEDLRPDLVVLDLFGVAAPAANGLDLCVRLRRRGAVPIIVLSSWDDETLRIRALEQGADDFIVKGCGERELVARLRAALRRAKGKSIDCQRESTLVGGDVALDPESHDVWIRGERISLPHREFQVLHLLLRNKGNVVTHRRLLNEIWFEAVSSGARSLEAQIRRLRARIEVDPAHPVRIVSVRGLGYKFEPSEPLAASSTRNTTGGVPLAAPARSTCSAIQ